MWDDDDVWWAAWIFDDLPRMGPLGCLVFLVLVGGVAILVYSDAETCEDQCAVQPAKVLDGECYCVGSDGALRAP